MKYQLRKYRVRQRPYHCDSCDGRKPAVAYLETQASDATIAEMCEDCLEHLDEIFAALGVNPGDVEVES